MAMLDTEGQYCKCDRCGIEYEYTQEVHDFKYDFVRSLFYRRPQPTLPDFCSKCGQEVIPQIFALRDIDELSLYVNKLKGAINERQKNGSKNNRATSHNAG